MESGKATGTTTVKDILPTNIEPLPSPVGDGWTCSYTGKTLTCTTEAVVTAGNTFPLITVPVKLVNAPVGQEIRNDASVHNPNEKDKPCHPGNTMITGNEKFDSTAEGCKVDPKNTDPAVVKIPVPVGSQWAVPVCIGNMVTVGVYSSFEDCNNALNNAKPNHPSHMTLVCKLADDRTLADFRAMRDQIQRDTAACGGTTTTPPPAPYCGDGILNPANGEQCDPGTGRGIDDRTARAASLTCSADCRLKIEPTTQPGERPLDYQLQIQDFGKLGGTSYKNITFDSHGMVVGVNSKIFSLADKVNLIIKPVHRAPIILDSDNAFVVDSDNTSYISSSGIAAQ